MIGIVELLLLMGAFVLVVAALAFGAWVVRPVDQAARGRRHPPQFSLFDFLCLFILIQLPTGLIHGLLEVEQYAAIWVLDLFGWGASGAMWWVSVRTLSQAGVSNPRHRAVFLLLALPIAIFGSLALPAILLVIVAMIAEPRARAPATIGLLIAAALALFGAIYLCGRYTRWMLAAVQERGPNAPGQPSSNSSEQPRIREDRHGDLPTEPADD